MVCYNPFSARGLSVAAALVQATVGTSIVPRHESIRFQENIAIESNGMANIHITYAVPLSGAFSLHYGDCSPSVPAAKESHHHQIGETAVGNHPFAKRHSEWEGSRPEKFVWLVPENAMDGGCLFAYSGEELVGKSESVSVMKRQSRRGITLADVADAEGPWFDGVEYLKEKDPDAVFVAAAKTKTIGILGGGMSGLMSSVSSVI